MTRDALRSDFVAGFDYNGGDGMRATRAQGQVLRKPHFPDSKARIALTGAVLLLLLAFSAQFLLAQAPAPETEGPAQGDILSRDAGQIFTHRVTPRPGEICVVCNKPIGANDLVYLVAGQRVPVHRVNCDARLHANPSEYLAKLKPRGALLDATSVSVQTSYAWLYFGFYVLAGLVFGGLAAHRAFHVGRRPLAWLALGLVGNLPAYVVLLALPRRQARALGGIPPGLGKIASTYAPQACPQCGGENHPSARQCSVCGAKLNPTMESEAARVSSPSA